MRIDRLLHWCRFTRTRGLAQRMVDGGHIRLNRERVTRCSQPVGVGDVLTLPFGNPVTVVAIEQLPVRRGPADEAQSCYRVLDPAGESAIAAQGTARSAGRKQGNTPQ
ncbi:RNA-binding S4 domain-containing protein [Erythrobacter sp. HKB08]|uniref:RNA-binding S4 domain-containing protein n=1 Tax=Erythrobacter sp. HKB08 TaxID=2502843 RepID=UPI0010092092|nr:S4 domain-containing protein [Erythrobacter sp. HKB08]